MNKMKTCISLLLLSLSCILQTCFAPPVTQKNTESEPDSGYGGLEDYMEYHRYLKEVVNALESDPDFRVKLEKADESEIKSGKIADELQFVSHHVRTRLDEIKRVELQRLRELVEKKIKLEGQSNSVDEDPTNHHLDQDNPHTFEIEDLKKLIKKTTEDLAEADKIRKEEFKRYELEKEYQKQEKLNHTAGNDKEKLEKEYQELEQKHKKHEKLHQPGHKAQLEEVWEEQDQMQQDFDPKTFFMLHDVDSNGLWDQEEVKALFLKELDKMYQQGAPEDDMRERVEEMERMRESVFNEMDVNRDGFIDYTEFLKQTNSNDFKQDNGWQGLDEQTRPYTDEELAEYIRQHHAANQIPQYGYGAPQYPPPGGYQQVPPAAYHQQVPAGGYQQVPPNQQQFQPGQVPQMPPQPMDLNTNEIHPGQPQPPPHQQDQYKQQYVPNNVPQQQNHQQQYQQNVNNVPSSQYQPQQANNLPQQANNLPQQQNHHQQYQQNVNNVPSSQYQPQQANNVPQQGQGQQQQYQPNVPQYQQPPQQYQAPPQYQQNVGNQQAQSNNGPSHQPPQVAQANVQQHAK